MLVSIALFVIYSTLCNKHTDDKLGLSCLVILQVEGLKRRVVELETAEQESQELLQESKAYKQQSEQTLRETSARLEEALEDARVQVRELSAQVGLAENKAQSLEELLQLGDAKCKGLELKLAGLYSALRRTVGMNRKCLSGTSGSRRRSLSPWRSHMQIKGAIMDFCDVVMPITSR